MCTCRAWNHTRGLSPVPCQHAAQDICQQKRHIPYPHCHHILPFMSHKETGGYFWGYLGIQDGCSLTDYSLEKDSKQRTWCGSCWFGCHEQKCLREGLWICCLDVAWTLPLNALMVSFMLLLDTLCCFYIYILWLFLFPLFHCGVLFPVLNKSWTTVQPWATKQMSWQVVHLEEICLYEQQSVEKIVLYYC